MLFSYIKIKNNNCFLTHDLFLRAAFIKSGKIINREFKKDVLSFQRMRKIISARIIMMNIPDCALCTFVAFLRENDGTKKEFRTRAETNQQPH